MVRGNAPPSLPIVTVSLYARKGALTGVAVGKALVSAPEDIVVYLFNVLPREVLFANDRNGQNYAHHMFRSNIHSFKALLNVAGPELLKEESFSGKTFLHAAVELGHPGGVQFLLDTMDTELICRKCKVRGATALHYAVRKRSTVLAHMLAAAMPPEMRFEPDYSGYSAMQLAEEIEATPSGARCGLVDALAINVTKGAM